MSVIQVLTNIPCAKFIDICNALKISFLSFNKTAFYHTIHILYILKTNNPDLIVLAGFLWKFPEQILNQFKNKVINIHPALLPKYGGKGMYGIHVHDAIVANKESESGITIHYVNENYDEGAIIFQKKFEVLVCDTAEDVAAKIHTLEQKNFPKVIEQIILKNG